MKFYKLELINREENYNKMFGSMPNVGVLNPISTNKASMGKAGPPLGLGGQAMSGMQAGVGGKGMT